MSLFNEKLKDIQLNELLVVIVVLFLIQLILNSLNIIHFDSIFIDIFLIFYFIFKLKDNLPDKNDFSEVFAGDLLKYILVIVVLNVFLSYGFLYLSNYLLEIFPPLSFISGYNVSDSIMALGVLATIFLSPIVEELLFRGVFYNRLKIIVPTLFSVLISSLLFASLHSYGSVISAFIFGLCMSILYIKTDNILVPMFAHFLNNLLAEIIVVMDPTHIIFTNDTVIITISILAIVSFVIISNFLIKELNNLK